MDLRLKRLGALGCLHLLAGCMTVFPVPATGRGCDGQSADFFPSRAVVEQRARVELDCRDGVSVEALTDTEFSVTGCGQRRTYVCEADAVSGCSLEDAAEREGCSAAGS